MCNKWLLLLLTALGPATSWWPVLVQPNVGFPFWVPLACAALCTGLSTALARSSWPLFLLVSGLGTFGGICLGIAIWPPNDPIGAAIIPYYVVVNTLAVMLVALCAGLILKRQSISNKPLRRAVLAAIIACVAFGPVTLAVTPPIVRHRIARNDKLAAERFGSLKSAVEKTKAESPNQLCNGSALESNYSGPLFSNTDWQRITGNYVRQDGYAYMVYCREKGGDGYTIAATPITERGDGSRQFCTDESGRVGCKVEPDGSRDKCLPCPK